MSPGRSPFGAAVCEVVEREWPLALARVATGSLALSALMPVRNLLSRSFPIAALAVSLLRELHERERAAVHGRRWRRRSRAELGAAIERQPICVGSTVASAGELGDVLYYRSSVGERGEVSVGYYAFFSEERPWGNNWLTWTVLPALAVDLVYTHALLFAPGVQRAVYGKGDVEGFRILYSVGEEGRLTAERGAVAAR